MSGDASAAKRPNAERVRLLWGKHDRFLPPATFNYFRQYLPKAEVQLLEGCGHCPHLERPAELADAIARPLTIAAH